ncbi:MAG: patatin-like phospholipase PlpD [Rhodoferax sp.]
MVDILFSAFGVRPRRWILGLAAWMMCAAVSARPTVGLVLGGGGARGAAHVGVLEVLDEMQIPVDCVAGTSMGALVAGAWLAGRTPAQMRLALEQADWADLFQDNPDYSELSYRSRARAREFLPGSETGVDAQGLRYPTGFVFGQKIKLFFNRLVQAELGEPHIEALPVPLSIIATDIGTGERVVFREGSLTQAMHASMAVPGLLAPVQWQGRKLVDGGLVDNLPMGEVHERCQPDVVIAVNVGTPLMRAEQIQSWLTVSAQMVNILTEQNVGRSLAQLRENDVLIVPDLQGLSASDFARSREIADRGRAAALDLAQRLRPLRADAQRYAAWVQRLQRAVPPPAPLAGVEIAALTRVNPQWPGRHLADLVGAPLSLDALDKRLLRAYGDGDYENVDYSVLGPAQAPRLRVTATEKSWGPDYLRLGLNLQTNFNLDASYTLRAAYDRTWLNALGGELMVLGEIGRTSRLALQLYQPLEPTQRWFASASLARVRELHDLFSEDRRVSVYRLAHLTAQAGLGMSLGRWGQISLQWQDRRWRADLDTGEMIYATPVRIDTRGWRLALDLDQQDRLYWATRGWAVHASVFDAAQRGYSRLDVDARMAWPLGDWVLGLRGTYQGAIKGRLPLDDAGQLGGFLALSGYASGQVMGDALHFSQVRAERIVGRAPLGLRGDLRVGAALEQARVGTPYADLSRRSVLRSIALYVGGETPLGPLYLGYGQAAGRTPNLYLYLGTP